MIDTNHITYWENFDWDFFASRVPAGIEVRARLADGHYFTQGILIENKPYEESESETWTILGKPIIPTVHCLRVQDFDLPEEWGEIVDDLEFLIDGTWHTFEEVMTP